MKKGIVLIVTIGFITILTALITYMFSISDRIFHQAEKVEAKNQSAILYADVKAIMDTYVKDINDSDALSALLLGTPPFYDKQSDLSLHVKIESLSNKININSILIKNKIDPNIVEFLEKVSEVYNILDASFLIDLVLDTIDEDDIMRQAMSEISLENTKFSNSRIINMSHFETLIKYYVSIANDENILKVPWEKLIYFGENQRNAVDCDRMSEELINILDLNRGSILRCSDIEGEEAKKIADKFGLKSFNKEINYYILVTINYKVGFVEDRQSFTYDLKTNKVGEIELFN